MKAYNVDPVTMRSMPFWCVGNPLSDPFGGPVLPPIGSVEVAELLAGAAGEGLIEATAFHDDDLVPWDADNPEDDLDRNGKTYATMCAIREVLNEAGLKVNVAACNLHSDKVFRAGGLANPDPAIRALARKKVERSLRLGAFLGAQHFTYWVARDGFEVPVTVDWKNVYGWLADGLNGAYDYIRANDLNNYAGITIEPKPNEPRGHMFLPTAGHAAGFIFGHLKKPEFFGINPELLQHESMVLMNAVLTVSYLASMNKLFFVHLGSQIKAQFDNDYPPLIGPEGLKETAQMFWALRQIGWRGIVEYDCHMLRSDGDPDDPIGCRVEFIRDCTRGLAIAQLLADRLCEMKPVAGESDARVDLKATAMMCGLEEEEIVARMRRA